MNDQPSITVGQQSANRKRLIAAVTREQLETCGRDYRQHLAICAKLETPALCFDIFLVEWLECERGESANPTAQSDVGGVDDDYFKRNYDQMFDGQKGWE